MTSVTRRIVPLPLGAGNVMSSTNGRCGSSSERSSPAQRPSSASEPTQTISDGSASLRQIGSGVPQ